ncbi:MULTISPECIES: HDOD domain-containing protein [Pseudoalteromonas]|uniref:HDOD domain-containing protein n=1 Tax=Pseudoalteromonas TaxID=53246 RepID=UPI000FFE8679|nr:MULTISPECIES: HDOD domain-containing protein [Pseudoalteromonas]MCG9760342.1 HDOD domain-containing protein [Pseudoalteromonas sp. Isolate6]NKC21646.1 HDOD domain-containing protein [Pseudoalteromonas galatheae]RXE88294.1 HDOD domain-containing protein [Pseudoalteromonas sp. A757]
MIDLDDKVLADVKHGFNLPPKPALISELQAALATSDPDLNDIASIIAHDVSTSAAVLKIINSPLYGLARTVTDVKQAVVFLGLDSVSTLVTGFLLKQTFHQRTCCISLERFWDNASDIADSIMVIGNKLKSRVPIENLHLLGLFHDAGIAAMAVNYPDYMETLIAANKDYDKLLVDHEEEKYGTNHAIIGYFLAASWNLPQSICQMILCHHDPEFLSSCKDEEQKLAFAALKMAENFVHINKRFVAAPDWHLMKADVLRVLNLDEDDYQDIKEDLEEYFLELDEVAN